MSSTGGIGQGIILALSEDDTIGRIRTLQLPEWLAQAVDFTSLSELTWMKFLPGGVNDPGAFIADIFFNTEIVLPTLRKVQTALITFPLQTPNNGVKATLTGSGFITSLGWPNAATNEPLMQGVTFQFDGIGVVPAFTPETAS